MNKNYYAVIMAGGIGSRFWPLSTTDHPKQFHDMLGSGKTLIQKTYARLSAFVPVENILILTNEQYKGLVMEQLPAITEEQLVLEPAMRNTAPCILYAALKIRKMNPEGVMIVAPSDHWIENEKAFEEDVVKCFEKCAGERVLCTLGIQPTFPNTGFGYIEFEKDSQELKRVLQFREKPDYQTAREFLKQGNFLWNAGIFMWSVSTIIEAFQNYQPQQYELFQAGDAHYNNKGEQNFIAENYGKAENISIDYAILEKARDIFVLPASFDWNDLGTWGSLYDKLDKDHDKNAVVKARMITREATGNMIRSEEGKLVVLDGLKDFIVVDKPDVLLIFPREKEQQIKELVAQVKQRFGTDYI